MWCFVCSAVCSICDIIEVDQTLLNHFFWNGVSRCLFRFVLCAHLWRFLQKKRKKKMALPIGYEGYSQDLNSNNTPTFGYDGSSSEESSWSEWEDAESRPPCPPVKVLEKDSQTGPHVKIVITAKQSARLTEMWNAPHIFRYFCFSKLRRFNLWTEIFVHRILGVGRNVGNGNVENVWTWNRWTADRVDIFPVR